MERRYSARGGEFICVRLVLCLSLLWIEQLRICEIQSKVATVGASPTGYQFSQNQCFQFAQFADSGAAGIKIKEGFAYFGGIQGIERILLRQWQMTRPCHCL